MKKFILSVFAIVGCITAFAQREITVYTPTGRPIQTYEILYEQSADERATSEYYFWQWMAEENSQAVPVDGISGLYNCHGYALHMSDGQPRKLWMNEFSYLIYDNIAKYWSGTLPTYTLTPTIANATKVYYPQDDHTGVVRGPNLIESKWGGWPRMLHAPTDCPYPESTQLNYYTTKITGNDQLCSSGTYSTLNIPNASYTWSANQVAVQGNGSSATASIINVGTGWIQASITSPLSNTTILTEKKPLQMSVNAYISGPESVPYLKTATWTGVASCGAEPYIYEWHLKKGRLGSYYFIGAGRMLTLQSVKSTTTVMGASLPTLSEVSGSASTNSIFETTQMGAVIERQAPNTSTLFFLKLRVIDANGNDLYTMERRVSAVGSVNLVLGYSPESMMLSQELDAPMEAFIRVYPNPASTNLNVVIVDTDGLRTANVYKVQILDKSMRLVKEIETKAKQFSIPVSDLRKDMYFIQVVGNGKKLVDQFLVE